MQLVERHIVKKNNADIGKRIKRGLFKSSIGCYINADVNGSINILRKVNYQWLKHIGFLETKVG